MLLLRSTSLRHCLQMLRVEHTERLLKPAWPSLKRKRRKRRTKKRTKTKTKKAVKATRRAATKPRRKKKKKRRSPRTKTPSQTKSPKDQWLRIDSSCTATHSV